MFGPKNKKYQKDEPESNFCFLKQSKYFFSGFSVRDQTPKIVNRR